MSAWLFSAPAWIEGGCSMARSCWRSLAPLALILIVGCRSAARPPVPSSASGDEWTSYGRDGGTRFSPLGEVTPENVSRLTLAWTYRTGENRFDAPMEKKSTFETTPIMVDGTLYLTTGFNKVMALDPVTGKERWTF